ncbi:MAG: AbrB/MazE/SpoVT family DNA-binding domain-containing protein [Ancalomicrobiaceae bacterium]|nr:AbrB/MazE/SpoVT family DNA-binding domain-containing protein [Ancalomicrobiaceae bacterium]
MGVAKVTSKNQITIPADVRQAFHVEPGDELVFFPKLDGGLGVRVRRRRIGSGFGMAADGTVLSDRELKDAVGTAVAEGVAERLDRC